MKPQSEKNRSSKSMLQLVRFWGHQCGFDVRRFPSQMEDFQAIRTFLTGVDTVVDVGAAQGQFAQKIRKYGFTGALVSLEPLSASYARLVAESSRDENWTAWKYALASEGGERVMHIASNAGHSSSLNEMLDEHRAAAPDVSIVGTENVTVTTLDAFFETELNTTPLGRVGLKIDSQGSEMDILQGAQRALPLCDSVLIELSLAPLYESAGGWLEVIATLEQSGFQLCGIIPGFSSVSGELMQFDGVFRRGERKLP